MASFEMPNVDGMNSMDELKNAVGKMAKELGWLLNNIDWKNINELNISLNGGASVNIANEGITVNDGTNNTFTVNTAGEVTMTGATIQNILNSGFVRISDEGIKVNNGDHDTFTVDMNGEVTMTGAKVQSSENGYPRVEMNPDENLFGAYSAALNYLAILALGASQSPQLLFSAPNSNMFMYVAGLAAYLGATGADLRISTNRNIYLTPGANIYDVITPFDQFKDSSTNQTLYAMLLGKARSGSATSPGGAANGGITPGTVLRTADGGTVTWTGIPAHSHIQN